MVKPKGHRVNEKGLAGEWAFYTGHFPYFYPRHGTYAATSAYCQAYHPHPGRTGFLRCPAASEKDPEETVSQPGRRHRQRPGLCYGRDSEKLFPGQKWVRTCHSVRSARLVDRRYEQHGQTTTRHLVLRRPGRQRSTVALEVRPGPTLRHRP